MDRLLHDLKPVDWMVAEADGPPGKRVFFLQARKREILLTLLMEKEQVALLATSIINLMADIDERPDIDADSIPDVIVEYPLEPLFQVGQMGLGYEKSEQLFALFLQSVPAPETSAQIEEATAEADEEPPVVRLWATGSQIQAFSERALQVVEAGRPICPLCHEPINPDGHLCPRANGHADPLVL